jgi:hypothetical protein
VVDQPVVEPVFKGGGEGGHERMVNREL